MADLCEDADQPAEIRLYSCPRGFQVKPGFPRSSRDSLSRIDKFLQRHWHGSQPLSPQNPVAVDSQSHAAAPAARSKDAAQLVAAHLKSGFAAARRVALSDSDIKRSLRRSVTLMSAQPMLA